MPDTGQPRPLDYATPQPVRRPGFLERTNPNATWRSMLFKSLLHGGIAAALLGMVTWLKPAFRPPWEVWLIWEITAIMGGAVTEWQTLDD